MVFWHQGWGLVYHCLWPHKVPRDTKAWNVKPIKVKIRSQTFRQNFPLRRNISTTTSIEYKWILQCLAVSRGKSWKKIYVVKVFCVWMQVFDTLNPDREIYESNSFISTFLVLLPLEQIIPLLSIYLERARVSQH